MEREAFLSRVAAYRDEGWRLAIINATAVLPDGELPDGAFDLTWSFARDAAFEHLRERIVPGEEVPSISGLFGGAFLYENEMRELFGIDVVGIAVDLRGELYKTATKVPFSPSAIRARLEASGRPAAPPKHDATPRPPAAAKPAATPSAAPAETPSAAPTSGSPAPRRAESPATTPNSLPAVGPSESATPVSDEPTKPSAAPTSGSPAPRRAEGAATTPNSLPAVGPSESATPVSTRTSAHETCVSEGAEQATKLSPAPQTAPAPEARS